MLITFCSNNKTKIRNTFYKHKDIHKKSWSNSKRNRLHLCEQEVGNVAGGRQCLLRCWCRLWPLSTSGRDRDQTEENSQEKASPCLCSRKAERMCNSRRVRIVAIEPIQHSAAGLVNRRLVRIIQSQREEQCRDCIGMQRRHKHWIVDIRYNLEPHRQKERGEKQSRPSTHKSQTVRKNMYRDLDKDVKKVANKTTKTGLKSSATRYRQRLIEMISGRCTAWWGRWHVSTTTTTTTCPSSVKMERCSLQKKNRKSGGWNTSRRC